ncbi:DnaJ domain-containing protein [Exophiala viscosa]|uniref:DnaJ domain-containing protein n=1 Tax=Exophiala viscosa TaxID=2486360 RepID=A0AAN6DWH2_9EURO|nr:DnaJ domain-containing protein [Exophiala viscosa]KAI1622491.1 DnaJ domain-containing protein [Exophiala viscosa]
MSELPDYYAILEVAPSATEEEIKRAYKKAALKWHPDRVPSDSPERPRRTKMFQRINDAYYTLSEKSRRRDYDEARRFQGTAHYDEDADEEIPRKEPATGGASWASWGYNTFFGGQGHAAPEADGTANDQFKSAFEEMMDENDMADNAGDKKVPNRRFWSLIGGASGSALGFIVGGAVGVLPGAVAGSQLGKIRDTNQKPVYAVFQELDQGKKARILSELAAKIFSGAIS